MTAAYTDQAEKLRRLVRGDPATPEPQPRRGGARVIAVVSGKGGVGKTNVAVNLSVCLAQQRRRVVLVDADFGLANADVLLDVKTPYNLSHVVAGQRELDEIVIDAPGGIGFVTGASGIEAVADLSDFERKRFLGMLSRIEDEADVLVLDCAAGISRNVIAMAQSADHVLVVTTPEPTAMTDAYATIKVLDRQGGDTPKSVVVNMADSRDEANKVYTRLARVAQQFLQIDLGKGGYILQDEHVRLAVRQRTPVVLRYPRCPASACLVSIASRVARDTMDAEQRGRFWQRVVNFFF